MTTRTLRITLIDPVIASQDVATAAAPASLPYLPGAMLWGVFANHVYRDPALTADAPRLLHGGGPVFSDALPEVAGTVALPAPKSLHEPKDGGNWQDWTKAVRAADFKQMKFGQIGPWNTNALSKAPTVEVRMETTLRTAIDPAELRAAPGQIYGLQALAAGQSFLATVTGATDAVDLATAALLQAPRLGRSRNAEFGRVRIEAAAAPALPDPGPDPATILWCLSDLAAPDPDWQPTERPDRLLGVQVDWSRSFVRHRTYAPFNATWQTRMPERLVIARGSVLVLTSPVAPGAHRIGFWTEQGLGHVLASARAPLELLVGWVSQAVAPRVSAPPETDLTRLLRTRVEAQTKRAAQTSAALEVWTEWKPRYDAAKSLQGGTCGPTPSQWGALANLTAPAARAFLDRARNSTGAKERQSWQARFAPGRNGTFADCTLAVLDAEGEAGLSRTAKALRDALTRERWFDEA